MSKSDLYKFALDSMEDLTTTELEQRTGIVEWGKWSRGGLPDGRVGNGGLPSITDEEALRIDAQMARLKDDFYRAYYILVQIYKWEMTIRDLVRQLHISNREIMSNRDKGLSILYGRLSENVDTVHQKAYSFC